MDHIGYAVKDIEKSAALYVAAGWTISEIFNEDVQHVKIAFLKKPGMTKIELVAPLNEGRGGTYRQYASHARCESIPYLLCGRGYHASGRRSIRRGIQTALYAGRICGDE